MYADNSPLIGLAAKKAKKMINFGPLLSFERGTNL